MQDYLLSCDWGTSSFRLKLVDTLHHEIINEARSDRGVAIIFNRWNTADKENKLISLEHTYLNELQQNIQAISDKVLFDIQDVPVVISGMASSVIGMREVSYTPLPFPLDGSGSTVECIYPTLQCPHKIYLVSGVCSKMDVMRGEETQLIGLASMRKDIYTAKKILCILPGTHSKHVYINQGSIIDFHTYMTGELFNIIAHQSILKDAVFGDRALTELSMSQTDAFRCGIHNSQDSNLLHALFNVRINHLFKLLTKEDNFYYLSGLLIGSELNELSKRANGRIVLCSESNVNTLYKQAIQYLDMIDGTFLIDANIMDNAALEGHIKILHYQID